MVTKKILHEIEIRQCDFCDSVASSNCWGSHCEICGRDLCDEHLIRPLHGESFTVCPDCNKTDLSEIFKIISEIGEAYHQCKLKEEKLKNTLVELRKAREELQEDVE